MLGSKKKKAFANHHSLLSPSSKIVGDIYFSGDFYIEGNIKGNIHAEADKPSKLIIHQDAFVEGDIHVPNIVINGRVRGTVYATKHIELSAKAIVEGAIHYQSIEMVRGSQLIGQLVSLGAGLEEVAAPKPKAAAPVAAAAAKSK